MNGIIGNIFIPLFLSRLFLSFLIIFFFFYIHLNNRIRKKREQSIFHRNVSLEFCDNSTLYKSTLRNIPQQVGRFEDSFLGKSGKHSCQRISRYLSRWPINLAHVFVPFHEARISTGLSNFFRTFSAPFSSSPFFSCSFLWFFLTLRYCQY